MVTRELIEPRTGVTIAKPSVETLRRAILVERESLNLGRQLLKECLDWTTSALRGTPLTLCRT